MEKGEFLLIGLGFGAFALLGICYAYAVSKFTQTVTPNINVFSANNPIETIEKRSDQSHIINHHLNTAGRWYEIKLEPDIKAWQLKARGEYELLYAFEPTHANYMTLNAGETLFADTVPDRDINAIYVMCDDAGIIVEMEVWF